MKKTLLIFIFLSFIVTANNLPELGDYSSSKISENEEIINAIIENRNNKGDVLSTSRLAGIQAAKKTSDLIPLAHNLNLTKIEIEFSIDNKNNTIDCKGLVRCFGKTGVEMEALTSVSVALLTIYDMCKSFSKNLSISKIMLLKKSGGKSGSWSK